jgi:hypothetical protein
MPSPLMLYCGCALSPWPLASCAVTGCVNESCGEDWNCSVPSTLSRPLDQVLPLGVYEKKLVWATVTAACSTPYVEPSRSTMNSAPSPSFSCSVSKNGWSTQSRGWKKKYVMYQWVLVSTTE